MTQVFHNTELSRNVAIVLSGSKSGSTYVGCFVLLEVNVIVDEIKGFLQFSS